MSRITAALVTSATLVIGASLAHAADMPVRGQRVAPVPMYNWSGLYVGVHAGYATGDAGSSTLGGSADFDGFFAGGQIGYNWHLANSPWVIGIEADLAWTNIDDSAVVVIPPVTVAATSEVDFVGTARVRFGYAFDRMLLYVTGGLAWAHHEIAVATAIGGVVAGAASDNTHMGWTVGAGLEWAIWQNWSAKVEYLYMDFDDETYFSGTGAAFALDADVHTIKIGLNYRFGSGF